MLHGTGIFTKPFPLVHVDHFSPFIGKSSSPIRRILGSIFLEERSPRHVMALGLQNEGLAFFLRGFQAAMLRAFVPW